MPRDYTHQDYVACLPEPFRQRLAAAEPETTWWPWRDTTLHIARLRNSAAQARLMILHGAGGHSAALWPIAALAAELGYEVLAPDLPGYGRTRVPNPGAVRYPDWVDCVADLLAAENAADSRPLVLAGASIGGMLAYSAAARAGGVATLVVTCLLDPRDPVTWPALSRWGAWTVALARRMLGLSSRLTDNLRVPIRWLVPMTRIANDPVLARICTTDVRGGGSRIALGFLRSYLQSPPAVEPEAFQRPPVVLAHPAEDRWTPPTMSLGFFQRIAAPKRYVPLPHGGHFPIEPPALRELRALLEKLLGDLSAATAPASRASAASVKPT